MTAPSGPLPVAFDLVDRLEAAALSVDDMPTEDVAALLREAATVIEALAQSYDHVVIDVGSAADVAVERFAGLAPRAVLVAANPADPATRAARERMAMAGFADVTLVAGASQSVAA